MATKRHKQRNNKNHNKKVILLLILITSLTMTGCDNQEHCESKENINWKIIKWNKIIIHQDCSQWYNKTNIVKVTKFD